jgi:hypothetical protein
MRVIAVYLIGIYLVLNVLPASAKSSAAKRLSMPQMPTATEAPRFNEAAVEQVFKEYLGHTSRPFVTFHYESEGSNFAKNFDLSTEAGNLELVKAEMEGYFKANAKVGFYVASDPVASRRFGDGGGPKYRLMLVTLPAGLTYLDVSTDDKERELNGKLAAVVKDFRCALMLSTSQAIGGEGDECLLLKRKIFKSLGISAVRYDFRPDASRLEHVCPGKDGSAFVVTSSDWLEAKHLKVFTQSSRHESETRRYIQEILLDAPKKGSFEVKAREPLWSDLPTNASLSDSAKAWMRESLVNCQDEPHSQSYSESAEKEDGDIISAY